MDVYNLIITLCALSASAVRADLLCPVDIVTPKWYTPEFEHSVDIEFLTTTKTVINGEETFTEEDMIKVLIIDLGNGQTPGEPSTHATFIRDSTGEFHVVSSQFNGTHLCLGYDVSKGRDNGGTSSTCEKTCVAAFNSSRQELLYYSGNGSSPTLFDYLIVRTKHANVKSAIRCYTREEPYSDDSPPEHKFPGSVDYCPLGEKCTVTVARKAASSPLLYFARCQPNNTDICESQGCRQNTAAPSVGEGMYHSVCDWCCGFNQCNNIKNCTQDACHFYGAPVVEEEVEEDEDKDVTCGAGCVSCIWTWYMAMFVTLRFLHIY